MTRVAITSVRAREVFDSRGVPTIEVDVCAGSGRGRSAAPFGAPGSRGEFEASAYGALGVTTAVQMVETYFTHLVVFWFATVFLACEVLLCRFDGSLCFCLCGGNTSI